MREIQLHLDEELARTLLRSLDGLGEHWAAGAPMPNPPPEVHQRLRTVSEQLRTQLGVPRVAEAMESDQAKLRQLAGVSPDEPVALRPVERGPAKVPENVLTGLEVIHSADKVDMSNKLQVISLARSLGLDEVARWIVVNQPLYAQGLIFGFVSENTGDEGIIKLWSPTDE